MAGTDDGTVEGEDSLTEEEVVEGERWFACEAGGTDWAARCVGVGEVTERVHRFLRECHA